jgi:hypothetical protein
VGLTFAAASVHTFTLMGDVFSSSRGPESDPKPALPGPSVSHQPSQELTTESLRLHLRYQQEFIEGFNLCPWAKGARLTQNTIAVVDDGRPLLEQLQDVAQLPSEIVFLILPTYQGGRVEFEELVAQLIAEDAKRHRDSSPPFAMAAFHPAPLAREVTELSAEALVPYLRRSPNPTIQLVRLAALERVRQGEPTGTSFIDPSRIDFTQLLAAVTPHRPSLRHRIATANHATVASASGVLQAILDDILEDRRRTHVRLGLSPSPWEVSSAPT